MIRDYQESDWSGVCRVYDASRPLELASAGVEASFVPLARDPRRIASFTASVMVVWHEANTVTGFACHRGDYISGLFVDPASFRKGIGRALLRNLVPRMPGEPWLWAAKGNLAAVALYRGESFEITEERETTNGGLSCTVVKMMLRRPRPTSPGQSTR